jgi:hypothetical protein
MAPAMGHWDGPKCTPTAFAEDLMLLEPADGRRHKPVCYVFLTLFNFDGFFSEFCGLFSSQCRIQIGLLGSSTICTSPPAFF